MSSKIRILDEITVNQIKAGEVIENPASVVKELVENSLDAQSTEISIEIVSGGRQLIRVSDNGTGMSPDDALLSLEPHATSKLQTAEDISSILTMGFRGEALPSIASISKMTLITCHNNKGTMVSIEGGKIKKVASAPSAPGTTIEIKNLFYNVPVRRQFQRSPQSDAQKVEGVLRKCALAHPDVRFRFSHNGKKVFFLDSTSFEKRAEQVLGKHFMAATQPFTFESESISIKGFLGIPAYTKPNRSDQYLIINKRAVSVPMLGYAIKDGYGTRIPTNRHPIFLLNLTFTPGQVDINVHPQKKEVRLRQEARLRTMITQAVDHALGGRRLSVASAPPPPRLAFTPPPSTAPPKPVVAEQLTLEKPKPFILAQLGPFFLIDGLPPKILDPIGASARLIFDQLSQEQSEPIIEVQQLLIPKALQLNPNQTKIAFLHKDKLAKLGLELDEFGAQSLVLRGVPAKMGEQEAEGFLLEMLSLLADSDTAHGINHCLVEISMRAARKLAKTLTMDQAKELAAKLMESSNPQIAPNGKKTFIPLELDELAKRF